MSENKLISVRPYFAASKNATYRASIKELFRSLFLFLQENGLTTRTLLNPGDEVTPDMVIRECDVTTEGRLFLKSAKSKWLGSFDAGKSPSDTAVLVRELDRIRLTGKP